jgi:hypothetical protein
MATNNQGKQETPDNEIHSHAHMQVQQPVSDGQALLKETLHHLKGKRRRLFNSLFTNVLAYTVLFAIHFRSENTEDRPDAVIKFIFDWFCAGFLLATVIGLAWEFIGVFKHFRTGELKGLSFRMSDLPTEIQKQQHLPECRTLLGATLQDLKAQRPLIGFSTAWNLLAYALFWLRCMSDHHGPVYNVFGRLPYAEELACITLIGLVWGVVGVGGLLWSIGVSAKEKLLTDHIAAFLLRGTPQNAADGA